jgi:hypothetical protein
MTSWVKAVTDPLKAAGDLAQGLMDLRDITKLGGVVVKLNAEIIAAQRGALTAQQNEATMAEEIRGLKAKIVGLETWETEKQRYELQQRPPGAFVYALKSGMTNGEPSHDLCQTCYQRGKKSILQGTPETNMRYRVHLCPECKTTLAFGPQAPIPPTPRVIR